MRKYSYNNTQLHFDCLDIGRLKTLVQFPVIANDSVSFNMGGIARLAAFRAGLPLDAKVDMFAFFVPHRHCYGDLWPDLLEQGVDETVNLPTTQIKKAANYLGYGGTDSAGFITAPLHCRAGYARIWNRYFRYPSDRDRTTQGFGEFTDTEEASVVVDGSYNNLPQHHSHALLTGVPVCRMKSVWNTGVETRTNAADREVTVTGGKLDVVDLNKVRARYGSEQVRDWFVAADRYKDLMKMVFGDGRINIDADERPELLMHQSFWMSGHDVDGTDRETLGQYVGKSMKQFRFGFPRKHFAEHGQIWVMACVRFPEVVMGENAYMNTHGNMSYKDQAGDPRIVSKEPPVDMDLSDWFAGYASTKVIGKIPFGQWLRQRIPMAYTHERYEDVDGFPFLRHSDINANFKAVHYVDARDYDKVFSNPARLRHAQLHSRMEFNFKSIVPPVGTSIFTGAK